MRRSRTSPSEQYRLVMDCRQSGLSDARWCEEHGIQASTFYNWVTRLRKKDCEIEFLYLEKREAVAHQATTSLSSSATLTLSTKGGTYYVRSNFRRHHWFSIRI